MIRYRYGQFTGPAAPFVHVTIRDPNTGMEATDVPAQIDTGADRTVVPTAIISALGLKQSGSVLIEGFGSGPDSYPTFLAEISVRMLTTVAVIVLGSENEPHVLLGRDVLNHYRILLDGPALALEIG